MAIRLLNGAESLNNLYNNHHLSVFSELLICGLSFNPPLFIFQIFYKILTLSTIRESVKN